MAGRIFLAGLNLVVMATALGAAPPTPPVAPGQSASPSAPAPRPGPAAPAAAAAALPSDPSVSAVLATKPVADPMLPLTIPGYELRTLDRHKDVLFNVDGTWVRASVPVFVYFPTGPKSDAKGLAQLRRVYGQLIRLGQKPDWTAAELQAVIADLDGSIRLLEQSR